MLEKRGEWDARAFLRTIPASIWQEYKVAKAINDAEDDWRLENLRISVQQIEFVKRKPFKPPTFEEKKHVLRRIDGSVADTKPLRWH